MGLAHVVPPHLSWCVTTLRTRQYTFDLVLTLVWFTINLLVLGWSYCWTSVLLGILVSFLLGFHPVRALEVIIVIRWFGTTVSAIFFSCCLIYGLWWDTMRSRPVWLLYSKCLTTFCFFWSDLFARRSGATSVSLSLFVYILVSLFWCFLLVLSFASMLSGRFFSKFHGHLNVMS